MIPASLLGYSPYMATRLDGSTSTVERWLDGLAGPKLVEDPEHDFVSGNGSPASGDVKCPVCEKALSRDVEVERYDEDYDYYWGGMRLPLWIALIWQVPWRQRLDIFVIGFIVGMVVSGLGLLWGFVLSQY